MRRATAIFLLGLLALMVLASACTIKTAGNTGGNQETQTNTGNNQQTQTGTIARSEDISSISSDLNISAPNDIGGLDDLNVSDDVPQ